MTNDRTEDEWRAVLESQWSDKNEKPFSSYKPMSRVKAIWVCEKGHEWPARIQDRTRKTGCPYCTNRKVMKGFNDLGTIYPELAEEWNYEKNDGTPSDYMSRSSKKVWWKCSLGHEWPAQIKQWVRDHTNCPYCAHSKLLNGFNDLATLNPELASEWNQKNELSPSDVLPSATVRVWWKCKKGHEWPATVNKRANGKGCPYCAKKLPDDENNLLACYPDIASEWDYERNSKRPEEYRPLSNKKAWWICKKGHRWPAAIRGRINHGCPYCAGKKAVPGETDFGTLYPELALEWDTERNDSDYTKYTKSSHELAWWICPKGHHYRATIANRVQGKKCPDCRENK